MICITIVSHVVLVAYPFISLLYYTPIIYVFFKSEYAAELVVLILYTNLSRITDNDPVRNKIVCIYLQSTQMQGEVHSRDVLPTLSLLMDWFLESSFYQYTYD